MEDKSSNNQNLKNALCYVPLVSIVFFFVEKDKSKEFMKHIKYGSYLFFAYIILQILLWWVLWGVIFLLYLWIFIYLWYKAYNWQAIQIEYLDKFEGKFKDSLSETQKDKEKTDTKKDSEL